MRLNVSDTAIFSLTEQHKYLISIQRKQEVQGCITSVLQKD